MRQGVEHDTHPGKFCLDRVRGPIVVVAIARSLMGQVLRLHGRMECAETYVGRSMPCAGPYICPSWLANAAPRRRPLCAKWPKEDDVVTDRTVRPRSLLAE